jgi:hypothetical protein
MIKNLLRWFGINWSAGFGFFILFFLIGEEREIIFYGYIGTWVVVSGVFLSVYIIKPLIDAK